jgi:putative hydrolase of the HAD superfamily
MIKAVIFDCFGVLVEQSLGPFYKKFFESDTKKIRQAEQDMAESNKGQITYEEFIKRLSILAQSSYAEVRDYLETNPRNEGLLAYIQSSLKPHYKIGFLSNASDDWLNELFLPKDLELFDDFVLSYQTGYAKPEAQVYEISAANLGVRLDECVFVDDRPDYVAGARGTGMHALVYSDLETFKRDLARHLA